MKKYFTILLPLLITSSVFSSDSNKIERYLHKNFKIIELDNGYEPEVVPRNGTGNLVREVFDHNNNVVIKELHTKDGCIKKIVPLQPSAFDNRS